MTISHNNIKTVLVEPSHPGNIGATARAMKVMGFRRLVLVNPTDFQCYEATARASGADDLLAHAVVVETLSEAIADCQWVFGTSARKRTFQIPLVSPRACAELLGARPASEQVALVFGRENNGLSNEELELCTHHIKIPTDETFKSLNLASAVQILCYELNCMSLQKDGVPETSTEQRERVTASDLQSFYRHLQEVITETGFLRPEQPKKLMTRLKNLYNRAEVDPTELNILRGILASVQNRLDTGK